MKLGHHTPSPFLALLAPVAGGILLMTSCGGGPNHHRESSGGTSSGGDDSGGSGGDGGANGGSGGGGSDSGGGAGESSGGGGSTGGGGSGGTTGSGLAFPLTLTRIGSPNTGTAHLGLYFTVSDVFDEPVGGLVTEDFFAKENGASLDPFESAFRVGNPEGGLVIPTVLLLDLSRSVVEAGALEDLKAAASTIIDALDPAQELAILTFADSVTVRSDFSTDQDALQAAVDAITEADGISTNLYGALQDGYGRWQDGFRNYDTSTPDPELVAGMLIAVSDGNDTAGVSTLPQVINSRGTKRTLFIRVGDQLDLTIADQIATAGVIDAAGGFEELDMAVETAIQRVASLNEAIYIAEYCSPKRANSHELLFSVVGNETYLDGTDSSFCAPTVTGPSCNGTDLHCGDDPTGEFDYVCCAPTHPYLCAGQCYSSAEAAYSICGSSCAECSGADSGSGGADSGYAIELQFNANGFADEQCAGLFDDGTGGSGTGGSGTGGSGTGGSGTGGSGAAGMGGSGASSGDGGSGGP